MYDDNMSTMKAIRASGLSDAEIAARVGVNHSTAWRWRNGKVLPKPDEIVNLALVLSCAPSDIRPDLAKIFK